MKHLNNELTQEELNFEIDRFLNLNYCHVNNRYRFDCLLNDVTNKLIGNHMGEVKAAFEAQWKSFGYADESVWHEDRCGYTRMTPKNAHWLMWKASYVRTMLCMRES